MKPTCPSCQSKAKFLEQRPGDVQQYRSRWVFQQPSPRRQPVPTQAPNDVPIHQQAQKSYPYFISLDGIDSPLPHIILLPGPYSRLHGHSWDSHSCRGDGGGRWIASNVEEMEVCARDEQGNDDDGLDRVQRSARGHTDKRAGHHHGSLTRLQSTRSTNSSIDQRMKRPRNTKHSRQFRRSQTKAKSR
jgi:hypothetical protein